MNKQRKWEAPVVVGLIILILSLTLGEVSGGGLADSLLIFPFIGLLVFLGWLVVKGIMNYFKGIMNYFKQRPYRKRVEEELRENQKRREAAQKWAEERLAEKRRMESSSGAYPENWDAITTLIRARDGHRCKNCGASGVELHVHHIVPFGQRRHE